MLTRNAAASPEDAASGQSLTISGTADGPSPAFSATVSMVLDSVPTNALTLAEEALVTGPADPAPGTILLDAAPPVLLRGLSAVLPVRVLPLMEQTPPFVRFEMMTTEPVRLEDPNKPDSPKKPGITLNEFQFAACFAGRDSAHDSSTDRYPILSDRRRDLGRLRHSATGIANRLQRVDSPDDAVHRRRGYRRSACRCKGHQRKCGSHHRIRAASSIVRC